MQWVQDPSQSNVDNLNQVRRDVSRHFRNKKKAYLRAKIIIIIIIITTTTTNCN